VDNIISAVVVVFMTSFYHGVFHRLIVLEALNGIFDLRASLITVSTNLAHGTISADPLTLGSKARAIV
jgi:hypothetical protein